ncbi:MAG: hypothetical protein IT581_16905 [Verrucomicrobiales bacterium]|nr:hypothetical protein [Verrucomicrobiales bacterium]
MKTPRYLLVGIALAAVVFLALLLVASKRPGKTSETLRTASELLSIQQSMSQNNLSGFLPGNHARLTERLKKKKFTSVIVLPNMIIGSHSMSVAGFIIGTHLILTKDSSSNHWVVSEDVQLGARYWRNQVGTLDAIETGQTNPPAQVLSEVKI